MSVNANANATPKPPQWKIKYVIQNGLVEACEGAVLGLEFGALPTKIMPCNGMPIWGRRYVELPSIGTSASRQRIIELPS